MRFNKSPSNLFDVTTEEGLDPDFLDASAVERILAAVGEKSIPPGLDNQKLVMGLASCLATYSAAVQRRSDKPIKGRIRRLKSIQKAARRLGEELVPDDIWVNDLESECLMENVKYLANRLDWDINELTRQLEWGPDYAEEWLQHLRPRALSDRWRVRSPFEWVAGHYLPELLRAHFGIKPTFHRRNVPDSRAIRFIERALIELGITNSGRPYSRESIAKALTDVRTGRARKKGRGRG